ncbi:MAG: recombination mediator RecR [Deltaproteobacteria bacterium]|jgi:recombination protein RecR|nr:recombination mediator RecR [Deltaproteobacteria bacterium]
MLPPAFDNLIKSLSRLPGIGRKTARRLAFFLIDSPELGKDIASGLIDLPLVNNCRICGFYCSVDSVCSICSNPSRNSEILCIVTKPQDMMAIESSGSFKGRYHILFGNISPLDGITPEDIKLEELEKKIAEDNIQELILALDSTVDGETTSQYIFELFKDSVKISRIAAGIPFGGELEYTDKITITRALSRRTSLDD